MLMFWYLRRADDAYTGTDGKRKALIRGYSNQGCAHDRSARFALQGSRRVCPRWELFGLISLCFGTLLLPAYSISLSMCRVRSRKQELLLVLLTPKKVRGQNLALLLAFRRHLSFGTLETRLQ